MMASFEFYSMDHVNCFSLALTKNINYGAHKFSCLHSSHRQLLSESIHKGVIVEGII